MPYTSERPIPSRSAEELRATIPGWGADLNPADRPSVPRERRDLPPTGAHWRFPDEQPATGFRERSIEHARLTPVYGTSVALKGLSGVIRRFAYARFSEGRAARWLLLILGDRVDALESHLAALAAFRPVSPLTETGLRSEWRGHGFRSRFRRGRSDLSHQWMDPLIVAGPWLAAGVVVVLAIRRARRRG